MLKNLFKYPTFRKAISKSPYSPVHHFEVVNQSEESFEVVDKSEQSFEIVSSSSSVEMADFASKGTEYVNDMPRVLYDFEDEEICDVSSA